MRRTTRLGIIIGGVLLAGALIWELVAIPALVKYPNNLDISPHYAGTFTLFVNPSTAAPLATPTVVPLTIDRHIKVIKQQTGAHVVVVQETIDQHAGDLLTATQTNQYVMDRRTLRNLADPRAYAFTPTNVVDRSGAYRLNLPFNTKRNGQYSIYKNEIGTTYTMTGNTSVASVRENGLRLDRYSATVGTVPLSSAYMSELDKVVPLPRTLTVAQLAPQLQAAGVDLNGTLAALLPVISPSDLATLTSVAAKPISLTYVDSFGGQVSLEPTTGAEVNVAVDESVGAVPQLADLPTLQAILGRYPNVPQAVAASSGLAALAKAPPLKLFSFSYRQTPASVAEVAKKVKSLRGQIVLAKRTIPAGLVVLGAVALLVAVAGWVRGRRLAEIHPLPAPGQAAPEAPRRAG